MNPEIRPQRGPKYKKWILWSLMAGMFVWFHACQEIRFDTGSAVNIGFSTDTLSFDTVFTEVGSTTKYFKIYNHSNHFARIDRIEIRNASSRFRINVDGYQGPVVKDLEIPPKDSAYVFVEVTVDPDQPLSESPFVIEDELQVLRGDRVSAVTLTAWGQNANYIPRLDGARKQVLVTCDMNTWTWDDPKPYVIYGVLIVDSCTLEIPAGARVYVHGGKVFQGGSSYNDGVLYIGKNGKLKISGTAEQPVTFQTDRLEKDYQDRIGQWGRIHLAAESKGNVISHARLHHANIGVLVDSMAEVFIDHSIIGFNGNSSIAAFKGSVYAQNSLFHTAAGYNLRVDFGGNYDFDYCTFANIGFGQEAVGVTNYFCFARDGDQCTDGRASVLNLTMRNSILYSSKSDALVLADATDDPSYFRTRFENTVIRLDRLLNKDQYPDFLRDHPTVVQYHPGDPLFSDPSEYDFELDSISVARGIGVPLQGIPSDLNGKIRDSNHPDAGAFEF